MGLSVACAASPPAASEDGLCAGVFCDDFEDHDLGSQPASPWVTSTVRGAVVVDDSKAFSGTRSIKVSTDNGRYKRAFFYVEGSPSLPAAGNVVYGRMMFYMDEAAADGVHWTMIQGSGPLPDHTGVTAMYRYGGMWDGKLMANYETEGAATDCWNNSTTVMPTGTWTCMEWRFDGPQNELEFWLDGVSIGDLRVSAKGQGCIADELSGEWLAPNFERLTLGWESYQQDAAREAWIDDVVIAAKRIGCD